MTRKFWWSWKKGQEVNRISKCDLRIQTILKNLGREDIALKISKISK